MRQVRKWVRKSQKWTLNSIWVIQCLVVYTLSTSTHRQLNTLTYARSSHQSERNELIVWSRNRFTSNVAAVALLVRVAHGQKKKCISKSNRKVHGHKSTVTTPYSAQYKLLLCACTNKLDTECYICRATLMESNVCIFDRNFMHNFSIVIKTGSTNIKFPKNSTQFDCAFADACQVLTNSGASSITLKSNKNQRKKFHNNQFCQSIYNWK